MKCPLLTMIYQGRRDNYIVEGIACLKEDCAWYNRSDERCAVVDIAVSLDLAVAGLKAIHDQMPYKPTI